MKQTKKKSFLLYQDQEEVVNSLTDAQAGQLFKAIFKYNKGEDPQLDPILKIVFIPIRQALDRDEKKYQEICQKNRKNIIGRWHNKRDAKHTTEYDRIRPNTTGYEAIRSDTKHTDNDNDNDNDNKDTYISGRGKGRQSEIERIYSSYKSLINPNSRLTPASREKIRVRLKTYSVDELIKAMTNFSQDDWWMEHNASRGVAWFFHNDERIDQLLNLKPKRSTSAKWR